jgi:hypothetical protein
LKQDWDSKEDCVLNKCIYQVRVPEEQDAEAFVKFMREEYFPAVEPRTSTRVGLVTGLALLQRIDEHSQGSDAGNAHEFYLHVDWNGVTGCLDSWVHDEEVLRKLESFSARVKPLGAYWEHGEVEG